MENIIKSHKFFIKHSHRYLQDKPLAWKTKETYFPIRGSETRWYYPLSLKHKIYFPIAYFKFMYSCILNK